MNVGRITLSILCFTLLSHLCHAQKYGGFNQQRLLRMRDSLDRLLVVNPSASATLVRKGEVEFYSFSSVMRNTTKYDKDGNNTNFYGQELLFNSLLQVNVGLSRRRRINFGADVSYRAYRRDPESDGSLVSVFDNYDDNAAGLSYAGPRIRVQPFKRVSNFNVQSFVWFPIAPKEDQVELGSDRINWGNTLFFYKYFNQKFGILTSATFIFAFAGQATEADLTEFYLPVSLTLSYVITPKHIIYGSASYSRINDDVTRVMEGATGDFGQYGGGYQFMPSKRFLVNLAYYTHMFSRNYGGWSNLTFGVRVVL